MISFRFHLRPSTRAGSHPGRLFIRVVYRRQVKNIPTGYKVFPEEWDVSNHRLKLSPGPGDCPFADDAERIHYLQTLGKRMDMDLQRLAAIAEELQNGRGGLQLDTLCEVFLSTGTRDTLCGYTAHLSRMLTGLRQERTARAYLSAMRSFLDYVGSSTMLLKDIDPKIVKDYEVYIKGRGLSMNTLSFYMRNLKAIYNRAIKDKIILRPPYCPFENVYTGVHETKKRAFGVDEINMLCGLEKPLEEKISQCRYNGKEHGDLHGGRRSYRYYSGLLRSLRYFLFCFHARGMSFVDLAYLQKNDIDGEFISYYRKKTGQRMDIRITGPMSEIIARFTAETEGSPYVFPIIRPGRGNERKQYESGLAIQNIRLKTLSEMAGIGKNLTTHVSRHSWATIAKKELYPVQLISEALGHSDVRTTLKYLASFEQTELDKLSEGISDKVKRIS